MVQAASCGNSIDRFRTNTMHIEHAGRPRCGRHVVKAASQECNITEGDCLQIDLSRHESGSDATRRVFYVPFYISTGGDYPK